MEPNIPDSATQSYLTSTAFYCGSSCMFTGRRDQNTCIGKDKVVLVGELIYIHNLIAT